VAEVVEGVQAVEVIEGTSLPLLGHVDDLDTLDYFGCTAIPIEW
jgi:hypothetical protein